MCWHFYEAQDLRWSWRKANFFTETINWLDHRICPKCIEIASHSTDASKEHIFPRIDTKLKSFPSLCIVLKSSILKFAGIALPLSDKLRKNRLFNFLLSEKELEVMRSLHMKLISPPVLLLPYAGGRMTLDIDDCHVQVGCVPLQEQPGKTERPIRYWSRSLTGAERVYSTTQRNCFAIVRAVLQLWL